MNLEKFKSNFIVLHKNSKKVINGKAVSFSNEEISNYIHNGYNLGLLSKNDFIFIDMDKSENIDGIKDFSKWCSDNEIDFDLLKKKALIQNTPSGGMHMIFLKPKNCDFKHNISLLEGVDIIGNPSSYIVVDPSETEKGKYNLINSKQQPVEISSNLLLKITQK